METWTEARRAKLQQWVDAQGRLIWHELAMRAEGEPSGFFDDDGNPGKLVSDAEGRRILALAKNRLETRIKNAGLVVTDLQMENYKPEGYPPGHSRCRVSFNIADESPVPYQFR